MKKILLLLILSFPFVLQAQNVYSYIEEPICWTINGVDSSLTRIYLVSDRTPDQRLLLYTINAAFDTVSVTTDSISFGWCDCCGGGSGDDLSPWKDIDTTNTNSQTAYVFRSGDVSIGVNDNSHNLRLDGDFQFQFPNNTGIFDWRESGSSDWDRTGLLLQDNGEINSFPFTGRNVFGLAANNGSIFDRTILGAILWAGTDPVGGDLSTTAGIIGQADGNWSTGDLATQLNFFITKDLESLPSNAMTLQSDGRLELDEYTNFNDGVPNSMVWYEDTDKDLFKTDIAGTPSSGDVIKVDGAGTGLEWGEAVTIDSIWRLNASNTYYTDGNVGIGLSNPSFLLDVGDGTSRLIRFSTGSNSSIYFGQSGNPRFGYAAGTADLIFSSEGAKPLVVGTFDGYDLAFGTNNNIHQIIKSDGKIGIGTSTPARELDIVGDVGLTNSDFYINSNTGISTLFFQESGITRGGMSNKNSVFQIFGGSSVNEHMVFSSVGDVGLNIVNPAVRLDILDGSGPQIRLRRNTTLYYDLRAEPDSTYSVTSSFGGTGRVLAGVSEAIPDNTDKTGSMIDQGSLQQLSDTNNDGDFSTYTIPANMNVVGMRISFDCKTGSTIDPDDGCQISVASGTIDGASTYEFTATNKIIVAEYYGAAFSWRINSGK